MLSQPGTAEFAGDENGVAGLGATTQRRPPLRHGAEDRDRDEQSLRVRRRFAAHNGHAVAAGQRPHAPVDRLDKIGVETLPQPQRDQRVRGRAGHRRDVAEWPGQCFVADLFGQRRGCEMDPFHHSVGLEQHPAVRQSQVDHRAIVAGPHHRAVVGGQRSGQARDEIEFIHRGSVEPRVVQSPSVS